MSLFRPPRAGALYEASRACRSAILLDNVRSLYNVGAFFRTADAAGVEKLYLAASPGGRPSSAISKTALGAESSVPWEHDCEPLRLLEAERGRGCEIAAVETTVHAVDLFDWRPRFPVCVIFGHEVDGIRPEISGALRTPTCASPCWA